MIFYNFEKKKPESVSFDCLYVLCKGSSSNNDGFELLMDKLKEKFPNEIEKLEKEIQLIKDVFSQCGDSIETTMEYTNYLLKLDEVKEEKEEKDVWIEIPIDKK